MKTYEFFRQDLNINDICFQSLQDETKIYFYEIYDLRVENLFYLTPTIILFCRNGEKIKIHYKKLQTSKDFTQFQDELNYIIESIFED